MVYERINIHNAVCMCISMHEHQVLPEMKPDVTLRRNVFSGKVCGTELLNAKNEISENCSLEFDSAAMFLNIIN